MGLLRGTMEMRNSTASIRKKETADYEQHRLDLGAANGALGRAVGTYIKTNCVNTRKMTSRRKDLDVIAFALEVAKESQGSQLEAASGASESAVGTHTSVENQQSRYSRK